MTYYQKRELARERISMEVRERLLSEFTGMPVIVLRSRSEIIRKSNKELVADILKDYECEDYAVNWRVLFDFMDDEDGIARISNFHVVVET